jgi:hypothetical protein
MRMLIHAKFPHEPFNTLVRSGKAGEVIQKVLAEIKPEAVYFTEYGGRRGSIFIVDISEASRIPSIAEPLFLNFNADVEFHPVMVPDELTRAGLDQIGKKWS